MTSDHQSQISRIFTRLCFHAGVRPEEYPDARARFITRLLPYPEDLLCAAYTYAQRNSLPGQVPEVQQFIDFMTPEYARRLEDECLVPSD